MNDVKWFKIRYRQWRRLIARHPFSYAVIVGILLLQIITVGGISWLGHVRNEQTLLGHMEKQMEGVISEALENTDGFLMLAESTAKLTAKLMQPILEHPWREQEVENLFLKEIQVFPDFEAVYFADLQGNFLLVKREVEDKLLTRITRIKGDNSETRLIWRDKSLKQLEVSDDYVDNFDPRKRPWYKKVSQAKQLIWTDAYIFHLSQQPGITTATPIRNTANEIIGYLGVDIKLSGLSLFLAQQDISPNGAPFVLDKAGDIVAYPDLEAIKYSKSDGAVRFAHADELGDPIIPIAVKQLEEVRNELQLHGKRTIELAVDGVNYHVVFAPFSGERRWPWIMGVYAPDNDFIGVFRKSQHQTTLQTILISFFITLLAIILARRLFRPVDILRKSVLHDTLTGLYNWRNISHLVTEKITSSDQSIKAVLMIDIDHFKHINDTYGHVIGDQILKGICKRVSNALSDDDLLARFGGDELAAIITVPNAETLVSITERLRCAVANKPFHTSSGSIDASVSIGVAEQDPDCDDIKQLLECADDALLSAKREGRDRVVFYNSLATAVA